jgi:hypothetical protein
MAKDDKVPAHRPGQEAAASDVARFLAKVKATPLAPNPGRRGRLIFALDATASRGPTWDRACQIQGEMFRETQSLGGIEIQLVYYRGFGEFVASSWLRRADELLREMTGVQFLGGQTQIAKVLRHAIDETKRQKVNALVFVGDALEEDVDKIAQLAGELGLLGVPAFVFQEGHDAAVRLGFEQVAKLTRGAYCPFDAGSARQLRELLAAVAVYAAGGRQALIDHAERAGGAALRLTHQLSRP